MHEHKETSRVQEFRRELVDIERLTALFKARKRFDLVAELEVKRDYTLHLIKEYGQML